MAMQKIISISALFYAMSVMSLEAADAKPAADAKDPCRLGRSQHASGDVLKAIKSLSKCVELQPRNREAWAALATSALEAGRFPQSVEAFANAESIKSGDETFLLGYLSALEGAGESEKRIPVLHRLASMNRSDRKDAEGLLAAIEAVDSGPSKFPEEHLFALQTLTDHPGADRFHVEKLAAAYLKRGAMEKAEAEYRGLLVNSPESGENWAGLGAALSATDPAAASDCYRKAAFYSNQAAQRSSYIAEQKRLATVKPKAISKTIDSDDAKVSAVLAVSAAPAAPAAPVASVPAVSAPVASTAVASTPAAAASIPDVKAASIPTAKPTVPDPAEDAKAKAEKERLAKEEKARQDALAKENEKKAKEEKARLEAIAKETEKKAKEEKEKQERLAKEAEKKAKEEKERLAKEEKARQEALAKEEKAKQENLAKEEKAKKDALAKQEALAKEERAKQDALAKTAPAPAPVPVVAAAAKPKPFDLKAFQDSVYNAELEKRLAALKVSKASAPSAPAPVVAAASPAPTTSVSAPAMAATPSKPDPAKEKEAREAEAKANAEKERLAKEEKENQARVAKEAEKKAKEEKELKERLAKEAEKKAKEEREQQERLAKEAEKKAKEEKKQQERLAKEAEKKAREDRKITEEFARKKAEAEKERLAKEEKLKQETLAKAEKARRDSLSLEAEKKAKAEKEQQERLAKAEAEKKAKAEKEKMELMAKVEKARQDSLSKEAEKKALADKAAKEKAELQAKAEKERLELMAKIEKARQDSLAREAEKKALADRLAKEKAEQLAKAEKARQDSLAMVAAIKAKVEKARQDSLALVAAIKAKAEKARQDSLAMAAAIKAKEEKARQEALAREAERKAKEELKLKQERDQSERIAKERRERHERAVAMFREGRMDSAALVFKAVLADSPVTDAFYYAGRVNLARNENGKALDLFQKAGSDKVGSDKVGAEKSDLNGLKGKALMGLGKNKEAAAALEAQLAKTNEDTTLADLVEVKRKLGDEAGAIGYLEKLAEKRPGIPRYQEELAAHYRAKGDRPKATERYTKVFILQPGHHEASYWLGMEAAKANDHARSVPFLERAVAAFPTRADSYKALAKGNAALGRKEQAWETHKKAFALAPADLELAKGKLALARESHPAELSKAYEDVLRIAPADADAAMGLAKLRYAQGNHAAAEGYFRIACKDSKDAHAHALFGRSLLELKKIDEASVVLQKAVDLGEKDPSLRLDLARIRMDKGDLDWAEALLKDLAKKAPSDPEPLYWQGRIAIKRQQVAVAEEFFRKSNQLKPDDGRYAESLARLQRDKDEWKQAVAVLSRAEAKLTPSGRLLYGECLVHGGDWAKAQTVYAELYKKEASASLLSRRMDLAVRTGKPEQAVALAGGTPFLEATEVRFSLAKAQLALAESHVLQGDLEQAVDLMKQVVKTDDHRPEYHYYLGLGYFNQNRHKKALDEFSDALTYRVDYPDALYRKGLCLIKIGDVKEAENSFGELTQHAEPIWKARGLYGLAMIFEAQGKPEAVQHHLERSIAAMPLADAMAYLSRVHLRNSRVVEAQDWARKAQSAEPSNEGATVALTEALAGAKRQSEAMELARQGLRAKPLSCGLLVQSAKLNFQAGQLDSTLAAGNSAIKACPEEPMGYYYAGIATHGSKRPKEAKQYFKSFRKMGGDKKLVPGE
jgi:tetratricopeptide (TPR) repeat protein